MNINRNLNKVKVDKSGKIPLTFDIRVLNLFCSFVISENKYIRKHHLMNLRKVIDIIDPSTYENDIDKVNRIRFINKALEAKLDRRLTNKDMIIEHIFSGLAMDIDFVDLDNDNLEESEIEWINETITEALNYSFVYQHIDQFQDICARFKATDYRYRGNIVSEFENALDEAKNSFRQAKTESLTDMTFSLMDGKFEQAVTDTYELVTASNRRLITMMQGFNEMLNGGFENGRVYMLFGMTAVGKSITLLNLIYQMRRANTFYKGKNPGKRPCILLLTMENSVVETITRLFELAVQEGKMNNFSLEEVLYKLRTVGQLQLTDEFPIDIVIKYKANRSVDTSYLYSLASDLEDQGYEVIALIQDHVKRIRSVGKYSDLRIELGEVVNEFKNFAVEKDIPVISVSHLNRDAAKVIESGEQSGKRQDTTKLLGKSSVGESFLMLDNLDGGFIINLDYDEEGNKYMVFSSTKVREDHSRTYIAQPFVGGKGIRLVEDLYCMPLFRESLHTNDLQQSMNLKQNMRVSSYTDISEMDAMIKQNRFNNVNSSEDNLFNSATKYESYRVVENFDDEELEEEQLKVPKKMVEQDTTSVSPIIFYNEKENNESEEAIYFY